MPAGRRQPDDGEAREIFLPYRTESRSLPLPLPLPFTRRRAHSLSKSLPEIVSMPIISPPAIEISRVAVAAPVPHVLSRFPGMVWPPVPYPLPREASIRKICHSAPHLHKVHTRSPSRRCSGSLPPIDATPTSGPAVPPR